MKVLLDTDIGGDFDDANALALLGSLPDVDIVGVTTFGAGGSARKRAQLAAHILRLLGRPDIPVFAGCDETTNPNPLLDSLPPDIILNAHEESMVGEHVSEVPAVEAILDLVGEHGASLTLIGIAAQTNIAKAIEKSPEIMARVGRIVVMGGAFGIQYREANVTIDPDAASRVLASGLKITAVGIEEARRLVLPLSAYETAPFASPHIGQLYRRMARKYSDAYRTSSVILYDVTTVCAATRPSWFDLQEVRVAVELDGRYTRGMTVIEQDQFFNKVPEASRISIVTGHATSNTLNLFESSVLGTAPSAPSFRTTGI